jgi:hypothetical protein
MNSLRGQAAGAVVTASRLAAAAPGFMAKYLWLILGIVIVLIMLAAGVLLYRRVQAGGGVAGLRGTCVSGSVRGLTGLAGLLAGRRYAHLRDAWAADLCGDPGAGELPSASRRLRLAAGDVIAAVRCHLDDAADLAWRPVDALLSSWHGSNLATFMPVTIAVGLVLTREGFYGLINDADNLGVIATAPYLAIKGLRKYRQIAAPKRPEKKASPADHAKR